MKSFFSQVIMALLVVGIWPGAIATTWAQNAPSPEWNQQKCSEVALQDLTKRSVVGKKVYVEVKFRGLNDSIIQVLDAPIVFFINPASANKTSFYKLFEQFKINQNIRLYGKLRFVEDSQDYKFDVFFAEESLGDIELFENRFERLRRDKSDTAYKKFYSLSKWAGKLAKLNIDSKGNYDEMGIQLYKASKRALVFGLRLKDSNTSKKDFAAQLQLAKDYLNLAKDKETAQKKFIACFYLKQDDREIIKILQGFGLIRLKEQDVVKWYKIEEFYRKQKLQKFKSPWEEGWYPLTRHRLMQEVTKRVKNPEIMVPPNAATRREFLQYAQNNRSVKKQFNRNLVIIAWGYPHHILKYRLKDNGSLYELWFYQNSRRFVFFEQNSREREARVLNYGTMQ